MNRVCLVGNLTKDPELKTFDSGNSVCKMRVAVNTRTKVDGDWQDKPNYFNVTAWGKLGERCSEYLAKGRQVAVDGRLEWREWESDNGRREAVEIIADDIRFIGPRQDAPAADESEFPF